MIKVISVVILSYEIVITPTDSFSQFVWSTWSQWPMSCSSTCKLGQRCRIRKCVDVKGKAVDSINCGKSDEAKECQNCAARGICPIDAGWSDWLSWSDCTIPNAKRCGIGLMKRIRVCNNPKPKYDGMFCIGNSTEEDKCALSCTDQQQESGFISKEINEHFESLSYNVKLLSQGDPVTLDCYTPAYLKASSTNKRLYVLWHFNGVPLRSLKELILEEMKALKGKINKAGAKFQVPTGHIQFVGSKLIIDSVSPEDSGVFTCVLNYDYSEYTNTFFVVIVLGKREFSKEFDEFTFNSNTNGLEKIESFDRAEIRWFLNRQLMISGLLAVVDKRFYTIYINKSMEGHWECHLFADFQKTKHWIVNSFELKITFPRSLLRKLLDVPVLHFFCYYFIFGIIFISIIFVASFLSVKSRLKTWLNFERKEAIIEEETQNNRLLLLVARKRAMNKTIDLMRDAGQLDSIYEDYETNDYEDN